MEECIIFRGILYDSVIHPFQIAFDGGDGGFDLMAQIGKEIGSDFLLMGEVLIEGVDCADERSELVLFLVLDLFVFPSGDDIGKIFHNRLDGTEGESYPEPRNNQNHYDDQKIYKKHRPNGLQDKLPFRRGIVEKGKIEDPGEKRIESFYEEQLFDGIFRDPYLLEGIYDSWGIGFRIGGKIFQRGGYSREIRDDSLVFLHGGIIEVFCLRKGSDEVEIDIRGFFLYVRQILREILRREVFERNDIHPDRHDEDEEYIDEEF